MTFPQLFVLDKGIFFDYQEYYSLFENASIVYRTNGHQVIQCSLRDIIERRHAEEALLHLAAIVESSDDAIIGKDLEGIITSWNAAAERMYGYSAQEIVGQPVTVLFAPERRGEFTQIMTRIRRGERVDHFETMRVCKDGTRLTTPGHEKELHYLARMDAQVNKLTKLINDLLDLSKMQTLGLLHRDIKPANILFDQDNNLYLTDFGIASWLGEKPAPDHCGQLPSLFSNFRSKRFSDKILSLTLAFSLLFLTKQSVGMGGTWPGRAIPRRVFSDKMSNSA